MPRSACNDCTTGSKRQPVTEAAWNYRFTARIGRAAQARQEKLTEAVKSMAWRAQLRLTARYARLNGRGVHHNKVCVAVARELAGFVWAIARASGAAKPQ